MRLTGSREQPLFYETCPEGSAPRCLLTSHSFLVYSIFYKQQERLTGQSDGQAYSVQRLQAVNKEALFFSQLPAFSTSNDVCLRPPFAQWLSFTQATFSPVAPGLTKNYNFTNPPHRAYCALRFNFLSKGEMGLAESSALYEPVARGGIPYFIELCIGLCFFHPPSLKSFFISQLGVVNRHWLFFLLLFILAKHTIHIQS